MPREAVFSKSRRYLTEARLTVRRVEASVVEATCRGDGGVVYVCGHDRGAFYCSCPARTMDCAHLLALRLVTVVSDPEVPARR